MGTDVLVRLRRILDDPRPSPRAIVTSLFDRESPVPRAEIEAELATADIECLLDLDLVRLVDDRYVPLARIDRVERLFVASDLRQRRIESDYVVGPGPASFLLARFVRPCGGGRGLDLGCGSGILSLLLATSGASVVAVDINPRAVALARFNAALNGHRNISARAGDFLTDEVADEIEDRFDTVVSNPPFVLAPSSRLVYRDRPLPGDRVGERTVRRVSRALAPGGRGYVLCNWIGRGKSDWSEPVRRWVTSLAVDAFVVRVGDHDPTQYAAAWNWDLPEPERGRAVSEWTRALEAEGVRRVYGGVIAMGRAHAGARRPPRFEARVRDDRTVDWQTVDAFLGS